MTQKISPGHKDKEKYVGGFLQNNIGMVKFAAIFLLLLWALSYLYSQYFLNTGLFEQYLNVCVPLVRDLLNLTGEQIELGHLPNRMMGEIRAHDGAVVRFGEGTDGLMIMAALVAAIAAWPGSLLKKLPTIILGIVFIFVLNILRIAAMLKIDVYWPLQFDLMNTWVLPGLLVLCALGFFLVWTRVSGRHPFDDNPT